MSLLFSKSEIDCIIRCADMYVDVLNVEINGVVLSTDTKKRLYNTVIPKVKSLTALTTFTQRELLFIRMALYYVYQLFLDSDDDYDLDGIATFILKIDSLLNIN